MVWIKRNVTKTPLLTDEDHLALEDEQEAAYVTLKAEFIEFFEFLNDFIDPIINPEIKEDEVELDEDGNPI